MVRGIKEETDMTVREYLNKSGRVIDEVLVLSDEYYCNVVDHRLREEIWMDMTVTGIKEKKNPFMEDVILYVR